MKHIHRLSWLLRVLLLSSLLPGAGCDRDDQPLPSDPKVLTGRLDNGMAYYVRQNRKPKGRLELRLVVKAGSILEDDDQQGLAHFLEHMAFNGTEHFERQQLVDYVESIGMRFGPELNAYTTFDHTAYRLQVPTTDSAVVDKGLLVLRDWASGIRNLDEEIQKERGVVIEEWRLGRGAMQRIRDQQYPVLFHGSRYALRLPIGKKEVLDSFKPDRLRSFYRDWYRPELMAVIAVGDVEPAAMVERIRAQFSAVAKQEKPRASGSFPLPGHAETLVSIASDKEAVNSSIALCLKRAAAVVTTARDYRADLVESLVFAMLNERLDELRRSANPPFLRASAGKWRLGVENEAIELDAQVKDNGFVKGLEAMLTEAERVRRHGFTESELARVRKSTMARVERAFNERETTESESYIGEYVGTFLRGDAAPGIEVERDLHRRLLPGITLSELNLVAAGLFAGSNRVILASGPEKTGVVAPAEAELLAVPGRVRQAEVKPYADDVGTGSLIGKEPAPGAVVGRREIDGLGVTVWQLSNGVTVMLKPTTFKKDQVVFTAFRPGGHSLVDDAGFIPAASAESVVADSGLGSFSETQLHKKLAGKEVSTHSYIGELREGLRGSARPEDLETAFQLMYLAFSPPRRDEEAFQAYRERTRNHLINRLSRPEEVFSDEIQTTLYGNHLRRQPWTVETLEKLNLDRSLEVYRQRFSSAQGFVFTFAGNFDMAGIEELVKKYIASLPSSGGKETWRDLGIRPVNGRVERTVLKGQDQKSRVTIIYSGDFEWSVLERFRIKAMLDVLNIRLRERIREEIGGTYSVRAASSLDRYPVGSCQIRIAFGCAPGQVEKLIQAVHAEIAKIRTAQVDDIYLAKVKQTLLKEREVAMEQNEFWLSVLDSCQWNGDDPVTVIKEFQKHVEELAKPDIQATAARYFGTTNVATFVLKPEAAATP
ncbi:MAG: hypothetical protein C0404_02925 [Verrucomicrobia bacterium]|nr:hypothetical protein [Verrucomicrobiota bacterium]